MDKNQAVELYHKATNNRRHFAEGHQTKWFFADGYVVSEDVFRPEALEYLQKKQSLTHVLIDNNVNTPEVKFVGQIDDKLIEIHEYIRGHHIYSNDKSTLGLQNTQVSDEDFREFSNEFNLTCARKFADLDQSIFDKLLRDIFTCTKKGMNVDFLPGNFILNKERGVYIIDLHAGTARENLCDEMITHLCYMMTDLFCITPIQMLENDPSNKDLATLIARIYSKCINSTMQYGIQAKDMNDHFSNQYYKFSKHYDGEDPQGKYEDAFEAKYIRQLAENFQNKIQVQKDCTK